MKSEILKTEFCKMQGCYLKFSEVNVNTLEYYSMINDSV